MNLALYDTRQRRKVLFAPRSTPATMYLCGMTPKAPPHIGHARLFVVADVFRRYLAWRDVPLTYVQNFTDVDDKIIERAQERGEEPLAYARRMTAAYFEVMEALNVQTADHYPRVTEHMEAIIRVITGLLERGAAYVVGGDVYFAVDAFPGYGRFSGRVEEGVEAGRRVEVDVQKRNPRDFALWKAAAPGEPAWDSPWGPGRAGWHIECTSMVFELLGPQIDLHAGGADLIFPHHENEIAQSEAYSGQAPFAHHWLHIGLLMAGSEKMAHSLNNYTTVASLLEQYPAEALRLYLLAVHYRSPMTFAPEHIAAQSRGLDRLAYAIQREVVASPPGPLSTCGEGGVSAPVIPAKAGIQHPLDAVAAQSRRRFMGAMDDDLNTAAALGALYDLAREINRAADAAAGSAPSEQAGALVQAQETLQELAGVLGVDLTAVAARLDSRQVGAAEPFLNLLLDVRRSLRGERLYALADMVRDRLVADGITLEDRADDTAWRRSDQHAELAASPLIGLLVKVRQRLRTERHFTLADTVRDHLAELDIAIEDRPDGSHWRRR